METKTITKKIEVKEFDKTIYNIRYKYGYHFQVYHNLAVKLIDFMKEAKIQNKKLIDVGCGIGWFSDMVYFNISRNIKGIDFSDKAIWLHAKRLYPAFDSEVADIYTYNYEGYDAMILMEVLEHIKDDIRLIEKFPKDSKIFATVPFEKERQDYTHVREYTMDDIWNRYGKIMKIESCKKFEQFIYFWGVKK